MVHNLPSGITALIVQFKQLLFLHTQISMNCLQIKGFCSLATSQRISFSTYTIFEDTAKYKSRFRYKVFREGVLTCVICSEAA